MGSLFARAHVTPSWSICQDSGWRNKFQQRRGAGDAGSGRWTDQSVSGRGGAHGEDWLSHFSSKVLWAGPGRAVQVPLCPSPSQSCLFTSSLQCCRFYCHVQKLFIPASCTSTCDLYQQSLVCGEATPTHPSAFQSVTVPPIPCYPQGIVSYLPRT